MPKQYEAVLNWQTQNANAQNQALHYLGKKIDKVASQVSQTEMKKELAKIDADKAQPSFFTKTQSIPIPAPLFTLYQPFYNPPKQSTYDQFFGFSHLHCTNPNIFPVTPIKPSSSKKSNQKSKSQSLHPRKIFKFQKTLLK